MSSKSSQEAMVAQVTKSSTSRSGYITRHGSRASSSSEKCCSNSASRARGTSASSIVSVMALMIALRVEIKAPSESRRPVNSKCHNQAR